jgi:glycosyltransferase involved in cell wall biosynthesis
MTRTLREKVQEFRPDVIHANDLSTLIAGLRLAKLTHSKLIYDSHEYEQGRNLKFSPLQNYLRRKQEAKGVKSADVIITVSESIADAIAAATDCDFKHASIFEGSIGTCEPGSNFRDQF